MFQQAREQTRDIPGVEWVKSTRPILIVDEPQSVGASPDGAGRKIMRAMEPLATIRYSATHVRKVPPVYRLDAFDAHDRGLVKSIEVDGARIQDAENSPYVKLIEVEVRKGQLPRARIEIAKQQAGSVSRQIGLGRDNDVLSDTHISGGRTVYNDYRIGIIQKMGRSAGTMQLMVPGHGVETLAVGESYGDVDQASLARAMIRQTIEHHFDKELRNGPLGIKTLSLFFVEAVKDYRLMTSRAMRRPDRWRPPSRRNTPSWRRWRIPDPVRQGARQSQGSAWRLLLAGQERALHRAVLE